MVARRAPSGTVTFLFTDVEGSTSLWEREPEAMRAGLARHDELLRSVLADHGGHVFSTAGDAFATAFASPVDAVRAALAVQEALDAEPWPTSTPITVRIGLHTGTADERDGDYFGPTLNRAARIMGIAAGGEVLVSAATAELARSLSRDGIGLEDLGLVELSGIGAEHVLGVVAPGQRATFAPRVVTGAQVRLPSLATSFVGRELELVELVAALPAARIVTLVGPGGVGKTRLAIEAGWAAAAEAFPDGVWLAELAPIRERDAVAHTLVTALEVRPTPGRTPVEALIAGLTGQHRLVVVDNCEHLLAEVSAVVRELVEHCPTIRFLATSRAPLAVPGEHVWPVAIQECWLGEASRALETLAALPQPRNPLLRCQRDWIRTLALLELDEPAAAVTLGRETVALARAIKATWMVDTVSNYLTAALAQAGEAAEALETMRAVLQHAASGGGIQSLANAVRNAIVLFARLGYAEAAATASGWLETQAIALPGTAGMRARAAEATARLAATLSAEGLAAARARGAAMETGELVNFLLDELDRAQSSVRTS